ncbi:MAG: riboflavin synthase, partial [Bacteroidota bacterium]|nr:riboflavin synthase [Bacteroidota bacterium]
MFTGLIEEIGIIKSLQPIGGGLKVTVACSKIMDDVKIDDSISINGVCQTVVSLNNNSFTIEAVEETLKKTTFKNFRNGSLVNLERAMKIGSRFGGHIVQGHVDCPGRINSIENLVTARLVHITFPA